MTESSTRHTGERLHFELSPLANGGVRLSFVSGDKVYTAKLTARQAKKLLSVLDSLKPEDDEIPPYSLIGMSAVPEGWDDFSQSMYLVISCCSEADFTDFDYKGDAPAS